MAKKGNFFLIFSDWGADRYIVSRWPTCNESFRRYTMARPMFFVVTDDQALANGAKALANSHNAQVQVYSSSDWQKNLANPGFSQQLLGDLPSLAGGQASQGAKILPFPGQENGGDPKKVRTINELESLAIEDAIQEYNGNLTEAAKALGIGRATLYRKVKQYNLDPSAARKKRVA